MFAAQSKKLCFFGVHWRDGEINVKIRFNKRVADYVRERTWHPSQEIVKCKEGDIILSLTVNHLLELKRWILSWGCDAQVLEPDSFTRDIGQTLIKASEIYKKISYNSARSLMAANGRAVLAIKSEPCYRRAQPALTKDPVTNT